MQPVCITACLPRQARPGTDVPLQAHSQRVKRKLYLHGAFNSRVHLWRLPAGHSRVPSEFLSVLDDDFPAKDASIQHTASPFRIHGDG